jgi:ribonuclease HI
MLIHEIYVDASFDSTKKVIGIGLYDATINKELFHSPNQFFKNTQEAEAYGIEFALNYAKYNNIKNFRIFTDNKTNYEEYLKEKTKLYELHWIPREHNGAADKNARKGLVVSRKTIIVPKDTKIKTKTKKRKEIGIDENGLSENEIETTTTKTITTEVSNTTTKKYMEWSQSVNIPEYISKNYSLEQRMGLFLKIAKKKQKLIELAKAIKNNKVTENSFFILSNYANVLNKINVKILNSGSLLVKDRIEHDLELRLFLSILTEEELVLLFSKKFFDKFKNKRLKNQSFEKMINYSKDID